MCLLSHSLNTLSTQVVRHLLGGRALVGRLVRPRDRRALHILAEDDRLARRELLALSLASLRRLARRVLLAARDDVRPRRAPRRGFASRRCCRSETNCWSGSESACWCCCDVGSAAAAFVEWRVLRVARDLPWRLCKGDVRENLRIFAMGSRPQGDGTPAKIWVLYNGGDVEEVVEAVICSARFASPSRRVNNNMRRLPC